MSAVGSDGGPATRLSSGSGGPDNQRAARDTQVDARDTAIVAAGEALIAEEVWPSAKKISERIAWSESVVERETDLLDRLKCQYADRWNRHPKLWADPRKKKAATPKPKPDAAAKIQAKLDHALGVIKEMKKHVESANLRAELAEDEAARLLLVRRTPRVREVQIEKAKEYGIEDVDKAMEILARKNAGRKRRKARGAN